ncbi:hypothetical protein H1215_10065, partial [Anoxybacillus sp. LAT_38]|nr:hypothetical protein [Anoxybacillus sp. LAT_38]
LAQELLEYAQEYYEDFATYYSAPNRRAHFPYVLKVLIQDDLQGIVHLLDA